MAGPTLPEIVRIASAGLKRYKKLPRQVFGSLVSFDPEVPGPQPLGRSQYVRLVNDEAVLCWMTITWMSQIHAPRVLIVHHEPTNGKVQDWEVAQTPDPEGYIDPFGLPELWPGASPAPENVTPPGELQEPDPGPEMQPAEAEQAEEQEEEEGEEEEEEEEEAEPKPKPPQKRKAKGRGKRK